MMLHLKVDSKVIFITFVLNIKLRRRQKEQT